MYFIWLFDFISLLLELLSPSPPTPPPVYVEVKHKERSKKRYWNVCCTSLYVCYLNARNLVSIHLSFNADLLLARHVTHLAAYTWTCVYSEPEIKVCQPSCEDITVI